MKVAAGEVDIRPIVNKREWWIQLELAVDTSELLYTNSPLSSYSCRRYRPPDTNHWSQFHQIHFLFYCSLGVLRSDTLLGLAGYQRTEENKDLEKV
jgi:hypothetical protein